MIDLLPCPFCGGEPTLNVIHECEDGAGEVEFAYVYCSHCGTQRGERPSEFTARQAWNLRAPAQAAMGPPVAWRLTDGEGGYEYLTEKPSDQSCAWSRRYGREWEPLYVSPLPSTHREADELSEWKQAASVEAGLRREFMAQVDAAREFVKRHPALTLIDLAEFEAFLKVPAMVDAALSSTSRGDAT